MGRAVADGAARWLCRDVRNSYDCNLHRRSGGCTGNGIGADGGGGDAMVPHAYTQYALVINKVGGAADGCKSYPVGTLFPLVGKCTVAGWCQCAGKCIRVAAGADCLWCCNGSGGHIVHGDPHGIGIGVTLYAA